MSSKINLQTCEYARKSSIFQDNQLIYFEILGLTMEDGEPVFHPQMPINCGHMRIRGFEVAGWLFDLDIDGKEVSVRKRKIS